MWFHTQDVSESDILGPIDHFSDIENLVSFERAMFQKQNKNIPILLVNITTLKYVPKAS